MEHIVFLTGRLAQPALERVITSIEPPAFTWEVREIGLQVAALMTADMAISSSVSPAMRSRTASQSSAMSIGTRRWSMIGPSSRSGVT